MSSTRIIGFKGEETTGKFCFNILCGYGDNQQLFCTANCMVARLAFLDKPVSDYDLQVAKKNGQYHWINMSVFCYRLKNGKKVLVHIFRNLKKNHFDTEFFSYLLEAAKNFPNLPPENGGNKNPRLDKLTPREHEVLLLLLKGKSTNNIAELLSISQSTVRNHIQSILQKFHVHSRLEAVTYAINSNLV